MSKTKTDKKSTKQRVLMLTESAAMIAIASVLSVVKIVDMPFGGSVTACSMLPLLIIGYRYGVSWGLLTSFTYGVIQMFLGLDNLAYATSAWAAIAIIVLDYFLAFVVLGLSGITRKITKNQTAALSIAAVSTGLLRYVCHVISGCTVWAGMALPTKDALIYSISYNFAYMLPEIVVLTAGAVLVSGILDFSESDIKRVPVRKGNSLAATIISAVGDLSLAVSFVLSVVFVAPSMQAEDGTFFPQGIVNADFVPVLIALGVGVLLFALSKVISAVIRKNKAKAQ